MSDNANKAWLNRVAAWGEFGYRASYDATAELVAGFPGAVLQLPFVKGAVSKHKPVDGVAVAQPDGGMRHIFATDILGWARYMLYKITHPMINVAERLVVRPIANIAGFMGAGVGLVAGLVLASMKIAAPLYTAVTKNNVVFAKRVNGVLGKNIAENYRVGVLGAMAGAVIGAIFGIMAPQFMLAMIIQGAGIGAGVAMRLNAVMKLGRWIVDNFRPLLEKIRLYIVAFIDKTREVLNNIKNVLADTFKNIIQAIRDFGSKIWAKLANLGESIKQVAKAAWAGVKRVANVVKDKILNFDRVIKDTVKWVWEQVKTVGRNIKLVYTTLRDKGISGVWELFKDKTFGAIMRYMANAQEATRLESEINQLVRAHLPADQVDAIMAVVRAHGEVLRNQGDIISKLNYYNAVVVQLANVTNVDSFAQKLAELNNPIVEPLVDAAADEDLDAALELSRTTATFTPSHDALISSAANDSATVTVEPMDVKQNSKKAAKK